MRPLPTKLIAFFTLFFAWHLSFAAQSRYVETACAYYSYPFILGSAGVAFAWDAFLARRNILRKLFLGAVKTVFVTHMIIDFNLLAFNMQRNLPAAIRAGFTGETGVTEIARPAVDAIRSASRIYIPYLHWEVLYWDFIRHNPAAIYTTGTFESVDPSTLNLISLFNQGQYLIGRSPDTTVAGLTYLGQTWNGYLFGSGSNVAQKNPDANHYFLLRGDVSRNPKDGSISGVQVNAYAFLGLENEGGVEIQIAAKSSHGHNWMSPWFTRNAGLHVLALPPEDTWTELLVRTKSYRSPDTISAVSQAGYPFSVSSPGYPFSVSSQ